MTSIQKYATVFKWFLVTCGTLIAILFTISLFMGISGHSYTFLASGDGYSSATTVSLPRPIEGVNALVHFGFLVMGLVYAYYLTKELQKGNAFSRLVIKFLKKISTLLLAAGLYNLIMSILVCITTYINSGYSSFNLALNFNLLFLGLVVRFIAALLQEGAKLQVEQDLTI